MNIKSYSLIISLLLLISAELYAAEKDIICAKYEKRWGWSKAYRLEATIIKGNELNRLTNSFSYKGLSTYVVIFWDEGEASVIEMNFGMIGIVDVTGKDQQGRRWKISRGNTICF